MRRAFGSRDNSPDWLCLDLTVTALRGEGFKDSTRILRVGDMHVNDFFCKQAISVLVSSQVSALQEEFTNWGKWPGAVPAIVIPWILSVPRFRPKIAVSIRLIDFCPHKTWPHSSSMNIHYHGKDNTTHLFYLQQPQNRTEHPDPLSESKISTPCPA